MGGPVTYRRPKNAGRNTIVERNIWKCQKLRDGVDFLYIMLI